MTGPAPRVYDYAHMIYSRIISVSLFLGLLSFSLSACLQDKTLDDYNNDKAIKDSARIQAVSGAYRGTLYSKKTGEALGPIEIEVHNEIINTTSGTQQAGISATVRLIRDGELEIGFPSAPFNTSGMRITNSAVVNLGSTNPLPVTVRLDASFDKSDTLSGEIFVQNQSRFGGQFKAQLNAQNAPELPSAPSVELGADILPGTQQDFVGFEFPDSGPSEILMEVRHKGFLTSAEKFVSLLKPDKIVDITIDRQSIRNTILGANWNTETGTIDSSGTVSGTNDKFPMSIGCTRKDLAIGVKGFVCNYSAAGNANGNFSVLLEPKRTFRGKLVSNLTQEILAPMEMTVLSDLSVLSGQANPQAQVGAAARIRIGNLKPLNVTFPVGSFDRAAGNLTQGFEAPMAGEGKVALVLISQINKNLIHGTLSAKNFEKYSGTFMLELNALPTVAPVQQANLARAAGLFDFTPGTSLAFEGEALFEKNNNRKSPFSIQLAYSLSGPDSPGGDIVLVGEEKLRSVQLLYNLVSPFRTVALTYNLGGGANQISKFARTTINLETGELIAGDVYSDGRSSFPLQCKLANLDQTTALNCTYTSAWGAADSFTSTLKLKQ